VIGGAGIGETAEEICHLIVNRKEALGLTSRFEALHDPLALAVCHARGFLRQALRIP
jgi:hypothetical protein